MKKTWTPTGIGTWKEVGLQDNSKAQIIVTCKAFDVQSEKLQEFIKRLEQAVSDYHATREIASQSKPSSVRKNLKSACKNALMLSDKLNKLDANSHLLIEESGDENIKGIRSKLCDIIIALGNASSLANSYPKKGRLVEYEKLNLGIGIADAMQTILEIRPTSTKEGLFEQLYSLVYRDISGKELTGAHTIIEKVISKFPRN